MPEETLQALRGLERSDDPAACAVGAAARAALLDGIEAEGGEWGRRIERLRAELDGSEEAVEVVDYGAGTPDADRSPTESSNGLVTSRTVGEVCRSSSTPPPWGRFLFALVRKLRPRACLEMGTGVGVSAAYQAAALRLNGSGHLVTLEGAGSLADIARQTLARLGLEGVTEVREGRFADTLPGAIEAHRPFGLVFVDGHHDGRATLGYCAAVSPALGPNGLVVFDDIDWSSGMARAWSAISSAPDVRLAVDMGRVGVCAFGGNAGRRLAVSLPGGPGS
jgi:predicted O-methyltransferase YrrM